MLVVHYVQNIPEVGTMGLFRSGLASSSFFKKWAIPGLFFFSYTVDSKQMFNK